MEMESERGRIIDVLKLLPPEIITEILSRLPADSAIGCRDICKQWRSLIDHPSFVDTHTRQVISSSTYNPKKFGNYLIPNSSPSSSGFFFCAQQDRNSFQLQFVEYNDCVDKLVPEFKPSKPIIDHPFPFYWDKGGFFMISSCNGLVFMASEQLDGMFISNPFTREYVNLGCPEGVRPFQEWEKKGYMAYGFGYLPSTNEYKVVSIYYWEALEGNVSVYTLGSGIGWRNKGRIPYGFLNVYNPGMFANGAIHWLTSDNSQKIVSFDLADEEFRMVVPSLPPIPSCYYVDQYGELGGCLCVTRTEIIKCDESRKDIWVLNVHTKEEGEEEFSWIKKFSIPGKGITSAQVVLNSGKILLLGGTTGLISYDPKTKAFVREGNNFPYHSPYLVRVIPYTKSFVSLKALGEEGAKRY